MNHDRKIESRSDFQLGLEPAPLEPPRRVIVKVIQAGLANGDDFGVRSGELPDRLEVGVRGLRNGVGMDPRRRPERRMTLRELRSNPGILEIRSDRDHAGDARLQRRIENGPPILVEAAVCEMAVTVEHGPS